MKERNLCFYNKNIARILALILTIVLIATSGISIEAARSSTKGGVSSYNQSGQNYNTWSSPMSSYLYVNEDGTLTRVEKVDGKIIYEEYDKNYKLINKGSIKMELDKFGGFYAGKDANYLAFGQNNKEEDKKCEVFRVVKYTKDWKREKSCGLKDCNTTVPFYAGSLRFAESGNMLYIRTAHEMYKSSDGYNHQANLTMSVNTSTMTITDSYSKVMNVGVGYVSHSFNQFIQVNGEELLAVDHGDAYPRSVVLIKYDQPAGKTTFTGSCSYIDLLEFPGEIGQNSTGGSIGGFEVSKSSYIVAGNYANTDSSVRNIFISVTPQGELIDGNTNLKYLTKYKKNSNVVVSTPQLVKIDNNKLMVLWETTDKKSEINQVNYVMIDGEGKTQTEVRTMRGYLSDCQPIVYNNNMVWYYTCNSAPIFCSIPTDGSAAEDNTIVGEEYTIGNITYIVSKSTSNTKTVAVKNIKNNKETTITIPGTITIKGEKFKVTEVKDYAFENCYNAKKIVFGSNITKIGNISMPYWNKVKTIVIKGTELKEVKKQVFQYLTDSTTIIVPKSKLSAYKKLLKGKGQGNKVKITK